MLDSDFDPGEATQDSQDEGDMSAHESHNEGENSSDRDTDYVDKVIKKDTALWVKARRRGRGKHDSDSLFDASADLKSDEMSPPQTLQELRGKKRVRSLSPPAHVSAKAPLSSPIPGPSSMVRTSTPNGPGAVTAAFTPESLDDTVEGDMYLGDLSDDEVIIMGQQAVPQDVTSGDSDSDTMDASDLNRQAQARHDAGADADDEDDAPDLQHGRHTCFHFGESFGSDQEQEEGDAEEDGKERPDDDPDAAADDSPPAPLTEGPGCTRKWAPASRNQSRTLWKLTIPRTRVSGS